MAASIARRNGAALAVGLTATRKKAIADIVAMGLELRWSEDQVRQRIKDAIGLDPRGVRAVENYRKARLAEGKTHGQANAAARAYSRRLVVARADLIADHEGRQAVADAQRELWAQMRQAGHVTPYAVRVTKGRDDVRRCPICKKENGRRRSLKTLSGGPPFHPRCRCWEELEDKGIVKADTTFISWDEVADMDISKAISPGGRPADASGLGTKPGPRRLTNYIRMVAHALMRKGTEKSKAIQMAYGIVRNWAEGKGDVSPKVRAAAVKALAEQAALNKKRSVSKSAREPWSLDAYSDIIKQLDKDGI